MRNRAMCESHPHLPLNNGNKRNHELYLDTLDYVCMAMSEYTISIKNIDFLEKPQISKLSPK